MPKDLIEIPLPQLMEHYGKKGRHYHNIEHVCYCLMEYDWIRGFCKHPSAVKIALMFHDTVYDSKASNNEELSAEVAEVWIQSQANAVNFWDTDEVWGGWEEQKNAASLLCKEVRRLIMLTKHDVAPDKNDFDGKYIVDIDLAIFGKDAATYADYADDIREEYSWVEDEIFKKKRIEVLKNFLARPSIYYSGFFKDKYEEKARENLSREIRMLS